MFLKCFVEKKMPGNSANCSQHSLIFYAPLGKRINEALAQTLMAVGIGQNRMT